MDTPVIKQSEKRYQNFLGVITNILPLAGIFLSIGLAAIYLAVPAWQLLAGAGAAFFATLGSGLSYVLFHRGKSNAALMVIILFVSILFITHDLLYASQPIFFIAGVWIVPLLLAWNATPSIRLKVIAPITSILATAVIIFIEIRQPVPRLYVSDLALLRWLIPLTAVVLGALLIIVVTRAMDSRRLYQRLLFSFLLIVFIPVITISATTSISSIQTDRQYAINTLENITAQKEDSLTLWINEIQFELLAIPQDPVAGPLTQTLLENRQGSDRLALVEYFKQVVIQMAHVEEIFLMDPSGKVVAASNPDRSYKNYRSQDFFTQGKAALYITPPFYFEDAGETSIFIALPVLDKRGQVIGVLAGRANMKTPLQIMATRAGLGTSGKVFLLSQNYEVLNGVIGSPTETMKTSAAVVAITEQGNGSLFYDNNQGIPVVGVYRWIPKLNVAVIAETNRAEAFGSVGYVLTTNIIIAIVSAVLTLMGALLIIQTINKPVNALLDTARQIAAGNLSARNQIEQEDELGLLARAINDTTAQMQELVMNLEHRVGERTRDLERRTKEVQTAAQIARDASTARNLDDLLNRSSRLISERFGFYHVGIFLLDERGEYALLSAATGEAGKLMLANKHKLRVGETGIVGYVTETGETRVALDTGEDASHFRNPFLPYTRSEMALPLKVGVRVIGALDVQSEKVNAFDQQDAETMRILADQIAVAIERTRLLQQLESTVARMEISSQEYSGRAWREFMQHTRSNMGFRYRGVKAEPITEPPAESLDAQVKSTTIVQNNMERGGSVLAVPVKLRGLTLGVLNIRFQGNEVPPQTIAVVEEAANRLALALENARLIQDTRRLAAREKQVNLITAQIQRATNIETVLQNAVRELGNTLGVPKTFIQIGFNNKNGNGANETDKSGEA